MIIYNKKALRSCVGVAFRTKKFFPVVNQLDFCKRECIAHIQLQTRFGMSLLRSEKQYIRNFLKENPKRSVSSHISSPKFDRNGIWINRTVIEEEISEVAHIGVEKVTVHPGKFDGTDSTMKNKILPHLLKLVMLGKDAGIVMCFENLPYKMWQDEWKQKFSVTPEDLCWLREKIVTIDPTLEPFCKFTLDTGHVAASNQPFRITPEEFANRLGWQHIYIIHANDVRQFKKIYGCKTDISLSDFYKKRMKEECDNKKLQQVRYLIKENSYLAKTYNDLMRSLDCVFRAHVPLNKGQINWASFWRAYLKHAPHRPQIFLELESIEEMRESIVAIP